MSRASGSLDATRAPAIPFGLRSRNVGGRPRLQDPGYVGDAMVKEQLHHARSMAPSEIVRRQIDFFELPGGWWHDQRPVSELLGMTVLSTTRSAAKEDALRRLGVDHVVVDDGGNVARQARAIVPDGVDAALELIGTPTLPDTLRAVRVHGVVCFTGMLSNEWVVRDFYPIEYLPRGVRLTAYGGDATDLPSAVLQEFLDAVAAGQAVVPIHRVYRLDQIAEAHADMEAGRAAGKLVVVP